MDQNTTYTQDQQQQSQPQQQQRPSQQQNYPNVQPTGQWQPQMGGPGPYQPYPPQQYPPQQYPPQQYPPQQYPPQQYPPQQYQPYPPQQYPPQQYPQQYPQGTTGDQMVVNAIPVAQVGASAAPINRARLGMWSDNICDCFSDVTSCLLGSCIAPYLYGRNVERSTLGEFRSACILYLVPWLLAIIFYILAGYYTPWPIFIAIVAHGCLVMLGTTFRTRLREKYAIPGSNFEDCCCHFWCTCCALTQESRHIDRDLGYLR